jgi:hypothetical protein
MVISGSVEKWIYFFICLKRVSRFSRFKREGVPPPM